MQFISLSVYQFISLSVYQCNWYMQTDKDSFINIRKIYEKIGYSVHLLLPQSQAITGCDTVSYFFKGELKKFSNT